MEGVQPGAHVGQGLTDFGERQVFDLLVGVVDDGEELGADRNETLTHVGKFGRHVPAKLGNRECGSLFRVRGDQITDRFRGE